AGVMRVLGYAPSGGRRRALQRAAERWGIDTGHVVRRHHVYADEAIAAAVRSGRSLREVALRLGAAPATGTLSRLRRRIAAAGIDASHLAGLSRPSHDLPFSRDELAEAAAAVRGFARAGPLARPRRGGQPRPCRAAAAAGAGGHRHLALHVRPRGHPRSGAP